METNVQPKGWLQKKMVKTIQGLVQEGFTLEDIYEAVCSIYPLMRDRDVCFLDLYLYNEFGRHHNGLKNAGDVLIGGLKVCMGPHERHFFKEKPKNVRYNSLTRLHFEGSDAFSSDASYMAIAVKVVNQRYGEDESVAEFKVDVEAKDKINPIETKGWYCTIGKDEYSRIVYIPLMPLSELLWISLVEENLKFWIKVYTNGSNDAAETLECFLAGERDCMLPAIKLVHGPERFEKSWNSTVSYGKGCDVKIEMYLRLWIDTDWMDTMPVTVEVKEDNACKQDPIYRKILDIPHYDGNVFHYKGQLFEDLVKCNLEIFKHDKTYSVSFLYMNDVMFWIKLKCFEGQLHYEGDYNCFIESEDLGKLWKEADKKWKENSSNIRDKREDEELQNPVLDLSGIDAPFTFAGEDLGLYTHQEEDESAVGKLQELIGLDGVKTWVDDLRKQVWLVNKRREIGLPAQMPFLHSCFYGNPGTGKTTVAKLLGKIFKEMGLLSRGHIVYKEKKSLVGQFLNSASDAIMEAVSEAQGGILFIDEAHNLYSPEEDSRNQGKEIIEALLSALADENRKDWMLILAGYPLEMDRMIKSNQGFEGRISNKIHFKDYTPDELLQIAQSYCKKHIYTLTNAAKEQLAMTIDHAYCNRGRNFENARYICNLMEKEVLKRMGHRLSGIENLTEEQLTTILPEDIPALNEMKGGEKYSKLKQMVGLAELKESIQSHLNYVKMSNNRKKAGLSSVMPPLHMVFTGNPGTGKTTVADFIGEIYASMGILSEGNVIKVSRKELVGQYIGTTEKKMREVFDRAKGNVLFIDEAYQLTCQEDSKDYGRHVVDALVDELGGEQNNFIVILAGYQKEMEKLLESNIGLASRFQNIFHFKDYSVEELVKIALESKVAKDFVFAPEALLRLEAYIRREVLKKQKGFGNGRFVTRLIGGKILPNMATRLSGIENPTVEELKTILAEDIPITAEEAQAVNGTGFDEKLINDSLAKLDTLVGLPKVKQAIHNFVDVARYRYSIGEKFVGDGVLKWSFAGNTGTGKSTVARIFADILKAMNLLAKGNFVEVKGEQIFNVSEHTCDEVLKSAVDRSRYGMLFIDGDAPEFKDTVSYTLTNEQLKIKLTQLTAENGGAGAIVVAECKAKRQNLVASMASNGIYEFDHTLVFDDYTPDELYRILAQCLAVHKVCFAPEATDSISKYIEAMYEDKGPSLANARTIKLLSRTIYEMVMLRESRGNNIPRRTVCLCDVEKFVWKRSSSILGYRK